MSLYGRLFAAGYDKFMACNRRTLENIESAGFRVVSVEHDRMRKAPPIVRPLIAGTAARI